MVTNDKIKVLQVNAGSGNFGGVSAMIFEIFKYIDKEKFQFDFLSPKLTTYELKREEIEKNGGNIIELKVKGNILVQKIQIYKKLKKILKQKNYNIVHINSGAFFFNLQIAMICKLSKVPKIIVHSHNALNPNKKIKKILIKLFKPTLNLFATDFLTCSNKAANAMFTKKMILKNNVKFIPNGIETQKFRFDKNIRNKYRKNLDVEDKFVIGHVGRFMEQKNHKFLIDVFYDYQKKHKKSCLILVGEGELKEDIENYTKSLGIMEKVKFLGLRDDVSNLMMAFDIFILPSLHEGLPVVGVEAQASGLPTIFSSNITKEVQILKSVEFLSLKSPKNIWSNAIEKLKELDRENAYKQVIKQGFDIKETVKRIEKIYLDIN